jgi:hypothetical protein
MMGANKNLAHEQRRSMMRYNGPAPGYRRRCDEAKGKGSVDFDVEADAPVRLGDGIGSSTAGREQ